jgi:hypothetical protein
MDRMIVLLACEGAAITPSAITRHAEMLLLCARIGYSPHSN